jgi:hypothetical protein
MCIIACSQRPHAREKAKSAFTVVFYGLGILRCKTAQFDLMPGKKGFVGLIYEKHAAQRCESLRKTR